MKENKSIKKEKREIEEDNKEVICKKEKKMKIEEIDLKKILVDSHEFLKEMFDSEEICKRKKLPAHEHLFDWKKDFKKAKENYKTYQEDLPKKTIEQMKDITTNKTSEVNDLLEKFGVAILTDVIDPFLNDLLFEKMLLEFEEKSDGITNLKNWNTKNTASRHRVGTYQTILGNGHVHWFLREYIYPIFCEIHGVKKLRTSLDGCSMFPSGLGKKTDWIHVDEIAWNKEVLVANKISIQSQVVLSNSSAAFQACVGDIEKHISLMEIIKENLEKKSEEEEKELKLPKFYKFKEEEYENIENIYENNNFRRNISAPKGSIIFWKSSTPHQSIRQKEASFWNKPNLSGDLFSSVESLKNIRCVVFITMLPPERYSTSFLKNFLLHYWNGRSTGHKGNLFPVLDKHDKKAKSDKVYNIMTNPEKSRIKITPLMLKLLSDLSIEHFGLSKDSLRDILN